jgi:hypothetical protein
MNHKRHDPQRDQRILNALRNMKPSLEIEPEPTNQTGYYVAHATGSGFDDDGTLIATTTANTLPQCDPLYAPSLSGATLDCVITARTLAEIGERAVLLAYVLKSFTAPKNLRELGHRLGCSHTAARTRLSKFKAGMEHFLKDFAP